MRFLAIWVGLSVLFVVAAAVGSAVRGEGIEMNDVLLLPIAAFVGAATLSILDRLGDDDGG